MIEVGSLVYSAKSQEFRQGVVYNKTLNNDGWAYCTVLWISGKRSEERVDSLKLSPSLSTQKNDLVALGDLQASIKAGATY